MLKSIPLLCCCAAFCVSACTSDTDTVAGPQASGSAINSSYARTLTVGDYLYGVDAENLVTLSLADPSMPAEIDRQPIGQQIETIYHLDGYLFIGSQDGMFTYDIGDDGVPNRRGRFDYDALDVPFDRCDPVVARGDVAFVTLYSQREGPCGGQVQFDALVAFDVRDIENPALIRQYDALTPRGLAIDGDLLFVCNSTFGLTVYDAGDAANLEQISRIENLEAFDVIANRGTLIVVGGTELTQFDYSDPTELRELSTIALP